MSGKKSPVEIVQARVNELAEIMLSGDNGQIRGASRDMAAKWGISNRQVERYKKAANRIIKDKRNQDIDTVYVRHIQERRELYKKALAEKDYRFALTVLQDIGKIEGIYSPEFVAMIKNEQNNFDLSTLPPERLEKVLLKFFEENANTMPPTQATKLIQDIKNKDLKENVRSALNMLCEEAERIDDDNRN